MAGWIEIGALGLTAHRVHSPEDTGTMVLGWLGSPPGGRCPHRRWKERGLPTMPDPFMEAASRDAAALRGFVIDYLLIRAIKGLAFR